MVVGGPPLEARASAFAQEVQQTLDAVLPGQRSIISRRVEGAERYIVQPRGDRPQDRRLAVYVDGECLAQLSLSIFLALDRTGTYLKTVRSDLAVHSVLDRTPLVRLEYRSDMRSEPIAHWQFHAERGAFSHLLARAHAHRPERVAKPHDLSSLHLPVGGERFRPCLEDLLQFLVVDCGVDHLPNWEAWICAGREVWRRRQVSAAVRDVPQEAARVLRELGYAVSEPDVASVPENVQALTRW